MITWGGQGWQGRIAVTAGDGIGREVIPAGIEVLTMVGCDHGLACEFVEFPWSCEYYLEHRRMMPPDELRPFDAVYLGAIGDYVPPSAGPYAGQLGPWARGRCADAGFCHRLLGHRHRDGRTLQER